MISDAMMSARNVERHIFTEEELDAELANLPDEITVTVEEAFGLDK